MTKNIPLVIVMAVAVAALGAALYYYFAGQLPQLPSITKQPSGLTEKLTAEEDLSALQLSAEEQQALTQEGLSMPDGKDAATEKLTTVNSSDGLDNIEKDINGTDIANMDFETGEIDATLEGL